MLICQLRCDEVFAHINLGMSSATLLPLSTLVYDSDAKKNDSPTAMSMSHRQESNLELRRRKGDVTSLLVQRYSEFIHGVQYFFRVVTYHPANQPVRVPVKSYPAKHGGTQYRQAQTRHSRQMFRTDVALFMKDAMKMYPFL